MKIVIAPDSFKESLSAVEVTDVIASALARAIPGCELVRFPLADGGEGTCEALVSSLNGKMFEESVLDANGKPIKAKWGLLPKLLGMNEIAVIEISAASGLESIPVSARNPQFASSYGTGQLIRYALDLGIRDFLIGLGGSATNDAGTGLLSALGLRLYAEDGTLIPLGATSLHKVSSINADEMDPRIKQSRFRIASDVSNPLLGQTGATTVYGPQKGVKPDMVADLDSALEIFANLSEEFTGIQQRDEQGAGAAGGAGFAFMQYFNAELFSGINLILDILKFDDQLEHTDLIITGEGRLDEQSINGKVPVGVAARAKQKGIPVIALCGSVSGRLENLESLGINACFSILPGVCTLQDALAQAAENLDQCAFQVGKLVALSLTPTLPKKVT